MPLSSDGGSYSRSFSWAAYATAEITKILRSDHDLHDADMEQAISDLAGRLLVAETAYVNVIADITANAAAAQAAVDSVYFRYNFDSATANANPGAGAFRFNSSNPSAATALYIHNSSLAGDDVSALIDTWDAVPNATTSRGTLYIRGKSDTDDYLVTQVTGTVTDAGGYQTVPITGLVASGAFTAAEEYTIHFVPSGVDAVADAAAIVAQITGSSTDLETLKDAIVADLDATDAQAIAADLAASSAAMSTLGAAFSGDIDAAALASNAVTAVKIAADAVTTAKIAAAAVTAAELADNAVVVDELGLSLGQALPVPLDYTDTTLWTAEFGAGIVTGSAATTSAAERFIITFNGSSSDGTQEIATTQTGSPEVATGQTVEARGWFANTGSPVDGVRLGIQFKDENFADVGGTTLTSIAPADIDAGGGWVTVQETAPVGARRMQIKVQRGGTNNAGTWFAGAMRARLVDIPSLVEAQSGMGTNPRDWSEARINDAILARSSIVKISTTNVTSAASAVDIPFSGYDFVIIRFGNVLPSADGSNFRLLSSSNGGSSFDTGVSDYLYNGFEVRNANFSNRFGDASEAFAQLTNVGVGSPSDEGMSGELRIFTPENAEYTHMTFDAIYESTNAYRVMGGIIRRNQSALNAVRFLFSSGNIASGKFVAHGYRG